MKLLNEKEEPLIRSATTYILTGDISDEEYDRIKSYCINPVDSRETDEVKPTTLIAHFDEPGDVEILQGFCDMDEEGLLELYHSLNLAMTIQDFEHIQNYFKHEEKEIHP